MYELGNSDDEINQRVISPFLAHHLASLHTWRHPPVKDPYPSLLFPQVYKIDDSGDIDNLIHKTPYTYM